MIHSYIQYYCLVWTVFSYKLATSLWTQPSLNIAVLSSLVFEKFVNNCRERQQLMKSITELLCNFVQFLCLCKH